MFVKARSTTKREDDTSKQDDEQQRLLREKTEAEEREKDFLEKKAEQLKKVAKLEKIELLEYYKFPTIMGWYFDGNFPKDFALHEEYAEYFNEIETQLDTQRDMIIDESFTEKVFRNFWPPKYIGVKYFRTRGVYLDFPEVQVDRPKTPPLINYEKQRGVIGMQMEVITKPTKLAKRKSRQPSFLTKSA